MAVGLKIMAMNTPMKLLIIMSPFGAKTGDHSCAYSLGT